MSKEAMNFLKNPTMENMNKLVKEADEFSKDLVKPTNKDYEAFSDHELLAIIAESLAGIKIDVEFLRQDLKKWFSP